MALVSGDFRRVNAVLLLLVAPIVGRIWLEAVVWRLATGPQMLGYSLLHAGAGGLTVPLLLSLLAGYIYVLWAGLVMLLWLIPGCRTRMSKVHFVVAGGASVIAFSLIADLLQQDMPMAFVLIGAGAMTAIAGVIALLIYYGLLRRHGGVPHVAV